MARVAVREGKQSLITRVDSTLWGREDLLIRGMYELTFLIYWIHPRAHGFMNLSVITPSIALSGNSIMKILFYFTWYGVEWTNKCILLSVAFCTIMAISRQKEDQSRDHALLLFRTTLRVLYSAQYHRQHCTLHALGQFGTLCMQNHDDKYPARPGFAPGTYKLQAPVDTNEPPKPAIS